MLAEHAVNVYVISATLWQVLIPVLMLAVGAAIGAVTAAWLAIISDRRARSRAVKQEVYIDNSDR